jgi:hypothetical protein
MPEKFASVLVTRVYLVDHSIGFDKDDWPNMADSTWGTNIYKHYGYTPYWEEVSVKTSTATKTAVGTVYVLL